MQSCIQWLIVAKLKLFNVGNALWQGSAFSLLLFITFLKWIDMRWHFRNRWISIQSVNISRCFFLFFSFQTIKKQVHFRILEWVLEKQRLRRWFSQVNRREHSRLIKKNIETCGEDIGIITDKELNTERKDKKIKSIDPPQFD